MSLASCSCAGAGTGNERCYNQFKYEFTLSSGSTVYTSVSELGVGEKGGTDSDCGAFKSCPCSAAAKHKQGDSVSCWQPAADKTKADLESFYSCPNDACIKIVDPKYTGKRENDILLAWLILSALSFVGAGIAILKEIYKRFYKAKKSPQEPPQDPLQAAAADVEFAIVLKKTADHSSLGVDVDPANSVYMVVVAVNGGLVAAWNQAHPDMEVKPGDHVMAVNGRSGNAQELVEACKAHDVLEMQIVRKQVGSLQCPTEEERAALDGAWTFVDGDGGAGNWYGKIEFEGNRGTGDKFDSVWTISRRSDRGFEGTFEDFGSPSGAFKATFEQGGQRIRIVCSEGPSAGQSATFEKAGNQSKQSGKEEMEI